MEGAFPWWKASAFRRARRIVVKVGTSTLTHENGKLNLLRIERLVRQLVDAVNQGKELILVTSGAVGAGMSRLGLKERPRSVPGQQAVAAVGQGLLMQVYEKLFAEYGHVVAQVLLTREDLQNRRRYLNSRNTLLKLFEYGAIPIVNENDTVAVDEIRFGDNDTLSALVASLIDADLLVILSDVDGLYSSDPHLDPQARRLEVVRELTPELWKAARGPGSHLGTGGMVTKLEAARIATASGCAMVLAHGAEEQVLLKILEGQQVGTLFLPRERMTGRKRWIAFHQQPRGSLSVDEGARRALAQEGKSLLPIGIVKVEGSFKQGDLVRVLDPSGREIARGLVNYSAKEVRQIQGLKTSEIEAALGMKAYDEVIHRDNLVITA